MSEDMIFRKVKKAIVSEQNPQLIESLLECGHIRYTRKDLGYADKRKCLSCDEILKKINHNQGD